MEPTKIMQRLLSGLRDIHLHPEWRVTVDNTLDGINPLDQSGFYVRCASAEEARERYWEAHPRVRHLRLHVLRWQEPVPLPAKSQ